MTAVFALLLLLVTVPPTPHAYVTDNVQALSSSAAAQISAELQTYENTTGHRVIVWIGDTTGDTPLEDWTIRAAEQWKIFKTKGRDDGAVLFVFMKDHKVRIEVGYGLESTLTDAASSRIIRRTIVPKMRSGDVDGAIRDGVDQMLLTITPSFRSRITHTVAGKSEASDDSNYTVIVVVAIWALITLFIVAFGRLGRKRRWRNSWILGSGYGGWGGGGGSSGSSGGGGFGGGFSGGFGGGGASGGW